VQISLLKLSKLLKLLKLLLILSLANTEERCVLLDVGLVTLEAEGGGIIAVDIEGGPARTAQTEASVPAGKEDFGLAAIIRGGEPPLP